jgi:thiol-disulfide isomerase/thioredoxin
VTQEFGGRVRFVEENYGSSRLAKRFGVTRYPAIFVGDVLVATPNDFGFYGKAGGSGGRYAPIRGAEGQRKFRADLEHMVRLLLDKRPAAARAVAAPAADGDIASWPAISLTDLDGRLLPRAGFTGRPVIAELWATWCPPCRATLNWLGAIKRRYGDRVEVVAISVESDSAAVRALSDELHLPFRWVLGTPATVRAFGDVSAVPTLHLFDAGGRRVQSFFGAPPELHANAERALGTLIR